MAVASRCFEASGNLYGGSDVQTTGEIDVGERASSAWYFLKGFSELSRTGVLGAD